MMAADKSRKEGTKMVLTTVSDLPQAGGVKSAPKTSKKRPTRNVGIVIERATQRASVGRPKYIPSRNCLYNDLPVYAPI